MARHSGSGAGNPNQHGARHTGQPQKQAGYPMGQSRRVTRENNTIEDRPGNDPNTRVRRSGR